jgi:hypothetical protein
MHRALWTFVLRVGNALPNGVHLRGQMHGWIVVTSVQFPNTGQRSTRAEQLHRSTPYVGVWVCVCVQAHMLLDCISEVGITRFESTALTQGAPQKGQKT